MSPKLAICIPTYNRSALIAECLESILSQGPAEGEIEVVIVDGGSNDNTREIVEGYRDRLPNLTYFRRERNVGVDEDILKVVELARAEYCWLISDDDQMELGSLEHIFRRLQEFPGIAGMSLNCTAYDKTMSYRVRSVPAASGGQLSDDYLFTDCDTCFSLLGIHLGYLSAQIVRREVWLAVVAQDDLTPYKGSCWLLVYLIGRMLGRNNHWLYVHRPCIRYRSGNDSFIARMGTYRRQLVTHRSYTDVIHALFGRESEVCRRVKHTLIRDRMPRTLANTKANGAPLALQARLFRLYTAEYWRFWTYWWKVVPLFLVPNFVFRTIRALYMRAKSRRRLAPSEVFRTQDSR